jgi:thymidylate synthase (FAD)
MNVTLIDHMGSDLSVVNAARVSFDKQSDWESSWGGRIGILKEADKKLISYLAKHNHWTPFGHCFASFRIKAPIFVARQLGKHQVGLVWNEVSRRYVDDEPEFYVPDTWRKRADNVKQGSSAETIPLDQYDGWDGKYIEEIIKEWPNEVYEDGRYQPEYPLDCRINEYLEDAHNIYKLLLKVGVCPEQARMVLPQSMMTEWVWSGSLAAFARVCKLRLDPHTQYETRLVASIIEGQMAKLFPVSWEALIETTH